MASKSQSLHSTMVGLWRRMRSGYFKSKLGDRTVLDPCCGGRMFYFDKHHPLVIYGDVRQESVSMTDRGKLRSLDIAPDVILDFTGMPFLDDSFNFVVFDPPHLINSGKNSWLAKKYGRLDKDSWRETLRDGLSECIRVVKPGCVVAMKWSEGDISTTELLRVLPYQPAFGDKQGKKRWLFFIKGMSQSKENKGGSNERRDF